mgnify:FL=1
MDEIQYTKEMLESYKILLDHGFGTDKFFATVDDFVRIVSTLIMLTENPKTLEFETTPSDSQKDRALASIKILAQMCLFVDATKPIADRFNPDDATKSAMAEFIMKHYTDEDKEDEDE